MPKAKAYYIRKNHITSIPRRVMFFDTETHPVYKGEYDLHQMYMGWAWYVNLKPDGEIKNEAWKFFDSSDKWTSYFYDKVYPKSTLYLIGSNILFDFFSSGLASQCIQNNWKSNFIYDKGLTTIIPLSKGKRRFKALALQNFVAGGVKDWGKLLGIEKKEVDFETDSFSTIKEYCRRDVEITGKMFLSYLSFVQSNDLGGFASTRASQSLRAYRHRFMDQQLLHYDEPKYNKFVRSAYMGGRVEAFRLGKLPQLPYTKLDINSMYPFVMKYYDYPTKIKQWLPSITISTLKDRLKEQCAIAKVTLDTNDPIYAKRYNGRLVFPIGTFDTYLCSGSLTRAIDNGHIKRIDSCILFEKDRIFSGFVSHFHNLKNQYEEENNPVWRLIVKLLMNSLYGKFGQEVPKEIVKEPDDTGDFYREDVYFSDDDIKGIETCCFGQRTITAGEIEAPMSHPAIAAHVTDYARLHLWKVIEQAGKNQVLYCDTDSIILPHSHTNRLKKFMDEEKLGFLKLEGVSRYLTIRGAKDYFFDTERKVKGIRSDAIKIGPNSYHQSRFPSLSTLMRMHLTDGFPIMSINKTLSHEYKKGFVEDTGNILPLTFSGNVLQEVRDPSGIDFKTLFA